MDQEQQVGPSSYWNSDKELVIKGEAVQLTLNAEQAHELLIILYDEQRDAIFKAVHADDRE